MHYSNRVLRRLALAALLGLSSLAASAQTALTCDGVLPVALP